MERKPKNKYMPSMAAFQLGEVTVTAYPSGCLRNILFTAYGLRDDIHPLYKMVGDLHENRYLEQLMRDSEIIEVDREVSIKTQIFGREEVEYSGRKDFSVTYEDGHEEIHETKATVSKSARSDVIRKGNVKLNHLAQLVSYMIADELTSGRIAVGYYEEDFDTDKVVCTEERVFKVEVAEDGRLLIDGQPSLYTIADQLRHMQAAADVLESPHIAPRPASENAWSSPCRMCPFSKACDRIDLTDPNLDTALKYAEESLKEYKPFEPKLFKPKRRPRK